MTPEDDKTLDFIKALDAAFTDGTEEIVLRPDVASVKLNRKSLEEGKDAIRAVVDMILKRQEFPGKGIPGVRLSDGFSFSYLSGCIVCGYMVLEPEDPKDTCSHCPGGTGSDFYITRTRAYLLALVGYVLKWWDCWPKLNEDEELWVADKQKGQLAQFPMLQLVMRGVGDE